MKSNVTTLGARLPSRDSLGAITAELPQRPFRWCIELPSHALFGFVALISALRAWTYWVFDDREVRCLDDRVAMKSTVGGYFRASENVILFDNLVEGMFEGPIDDVVGIRQRNHLGLIQVVVFARELLMQFPDEKPLLSALGDR